MSGTLSAPVTARAVVSRDALGVPHILAANQSDALFLQGYVTAQDRLFQMDGMRRLAAGELAEVVGQTALESDREARRLRLGKLADAYVRKLPAQDRAALAAYARGVNFFIETHRGRLPLEFTLLRYDPRPWSMADSALVALQLMSRLEGSWRSEVRKEALLAGGDAAKVNVLFPHGESRPGSNAWALAGKLTATHRPLLAGDPHLAFSLPSAWYMVHLRGPQLNVSGVSLPGLAGVLIGHNDRIAWSITSLQFDVQDLYVERFDPSTGRYAYDGKIEQARGEREVIRVRDGAPESMVNWVTRHGPILVNEGGRLLSLRWIAAENDLFQLPILDLDRARNWEEFRSALRRFPGPNVNFVYADVAGNIGYQAVGRLPIRKTYDGSVPVDGSSGKFEWEGVIPFDELPSIYNPPSGMIASANENPFPAGFPYRVSGDFFAPYRFQQIVNRLQSRAGWRSEDMLALQTDVYSAFDHFLAHQIVAAYTRRGNFYPTVADAVEALRRWDGQMASDGAAPLVATLTYEHLRTAVAERASKGKGLIYRSYMAPAVIEKLLRERPKEWFDDFDRFLLDNFADAVEEGRRIQGRDPARWEYGRSNNLTLSNLVVGKLPMLGKYFNVGPVPMSGSGETVKQIRMEDNLGPSMRMVVDLADWDRSRLNITLGQSGQVLSGHYRDQWDAYCEGRSFPMQFNRIDAKDTLVFLPER